MSMNTTKSKWDDFISESKHYLSGAGYNEESITIRKMTAGSVDRKKVDVNKDERFLIVSDNKRCIVVKLSAFNKLNKKHREDVLSVGSNHD